MEWSQIEEVNKELNTIPIEKKDKEGKIKRTDYAMVKERILAWRKIMPNGRYDSSIVYFENGRIIIKAVIYDENGNQIGCGFAEETDGKGYINQGSFVENCETSALGRALASLGIGVEGSYASADEVANAIINQDKPEEKITEQEASILRDMLVDLGRDIDKFKAKFKVAELTDLTKRQHATALKELNEIKKMQEVQK